MSAAKKLKTDDEKTPEYDWNVKARVINMGHKGWPNPGPKAPHWDVGEPPEDNEPLSMATVTKFKLNHGDMLRFLDYRYAHCLFVHRTSEGDYKCVSNPDEREAGYLTIPYEILEPVTDAMQKYKENFDDDSSLIAHLGHKDRLVREHLGEVIPDSWDIAVHYGFGSLEEIVIKQGEKQWRTASWNGISYEEIENHFQEENNSEYDSSSGTETEP